MMIYFYNFCNFLYWSLNLKKYLSKKFLIRIYLTIIDNVFGFLFRFLPKNKIPENVSKILIVKPDHLGDMLLTTSIFRLIRERFPFSQIDVVCGEWATSILENNPYINRKYIINVPFANRKNISIIKKWLKFIKTYFSTLKKIRRERYDIGLFLRSRRGNLISLALLGKIRYTIGHGVAGFGFLLSKEVEWKPHKHEVEHYLEILSPLDIKKELKDLIPELYTKEEDKKKAVEIFSSLPKNKKIAIVHPGSGNLLKTLSIENWQKIVVLLQKKNYFIALTGSKAEKDLLTSISKENENSKILAGVFSIQELFEFFKLVDLIITVDSLSSHLAGITGVKTIVFYSGITDIVQWKALGKNIKTYKIECKKSPCEIGCDEMKCMDFNIEEIIKEI